MEKLPLLILFVLGALLVTFGVFWLRLGGMVRAVDRQIAAEGVDGEATVTDRRTIHGRGSSSYYLSFDYTPRPAPGRPEKISQETEISREDYERLQPGDTVKIRYLPSAPKEVILTGGVQERTLPSFMTAGIGGIVAGALLLVVCVVAWLR